MITIDELKTLISKVGGDMSQAEAKALIQKADKNQNQGIDFSEFAKLWEALHGEEEVIIREISEKVIVVEQAAIRAEFAKIDTDKSGAITKGD